MRFRLVTYNMHKGIGGVDRRYRPERIVEVLAHCQPDIVCLQEVDDGVPRSRHHRQADLIADALELEHRAFFPNVSLRHGRYGNAIVSRFPLSDVRNIDLTIRLKKRRGAVVARCQLQSDHHARSVLLFNMHLGLSGFERSMQVRRLLTGDLLKHAQKNTAVIAAGDFNDIWGSLGRKFFLPDGFTQVSGRIKTYPAFRPLRPLDRIFVRGGFNVIHCFASRTRAARRASDHLPLVAEFELLT